MIVGIFRRRWAAILPLATTLVFHWSLVWASGRFFGLTYPTQATVRDLFFQLPVAYALVFLSRRPVPFVAVHGLFMAVLYLGHAAKTAFHGVPVTLDDVFVIPDLFRILPVWQQGTAVAVGAIGGGLLLANLRWRRAASAAAVVALALAVGPANSAARLSAALDRIYGNSVWDHRGNLLYRGVTLHTLQEWSRYLRDDRTPPVAAGVAEALDGLGAVRAPTAVEAVARRNVHMIVLESFWDPQVLVAAGFGRRVLDDRFYRLWAAADFSQVLTPVFGGYTANSEFEALCGFPVEEDAVKFERRFRNDVPALPRVLAGHGYVTAASHPNIPGFWNRTNAYRRMGFSTYWSWEHFQKDDMNREFLSDASLYRQVLEKIRPLMREKRPVFNYVVTFTGHWNYPLNDRRPPRVKHRSAIAEVGYFADTVYYKSRELADFIETLRQEDPDGLIVAFGDHPPFLGNNFAGYAESGILAPERADFTPAMLRTAYSTPLLIIDGKNGPVSAGRNLPLYRLPALVAELLGVPAGDMLALARPLPDMTVRPLPGVVLVLDESEVPIRCLPGDLSDGCRRGLDWLDRVAVVGEDLFTGRQFALRPGLIKSVGGSSPRQLAFEPPVDAVR